MNANDEEPTFGEYSGRLWPSADYHHQVECLRAAIGETIYLVELCETHIKLSVHVSDRGYELLDVIDFPRPDPERGLAPHLILLDDGRGVNLGRIARISYRPFQPAPEEVLYLDREADQKLLFADRRLSQHFITERTQAVLGQVLGHSPPSSSAKLEPMLSSEPVSDESANAGSGHAPKGADKGLGYAKTSGAGRTEYPL